MSRTYHNVTARYNVYFNAKESYKKGLKKIKNDYKDDFTTLLPLYPYPGVDAANIASGDMERCIKKSWKTINQHSITVKPEFKNGIRTKRQKELYNKKEYCAYIDDAYLMIGKGNLIKGELTTTTENLRQIIKNYPKENTYLEAQITLARTLILRDEPLEAEDILKTLYEKKDFPKKHKAFLNAVYTEFYIHKKKYPEAIEKLSVALKFAPDKLTRARWTFLLGQLYQQTGILTKATEMYNQVISMSPPYEMTFNARINLASAYQAGSYGADEIRKQLYKLLKDEKNKEFEDQIYYALGNLDFKDGKIEEAIKNYQISAAKSTSNKKQKALSYIAIADIQYNAKKYMPAQAYYDSAVNNIDETYNDYQRIATRSRSLTKLAKNLNMVSLEDSVQFIAKMSGNERNMFIDEIIAKVKAKEAEEAQRQQQAQMEQQENLNMANDLNYRNNSNVAAEGGKWYFYNPSAKSYGVAEFQMKWGKRKLEDNWRRSLRKSTGIETTTGDSSKEDEEEANAKKKNQDNKSREYYMENIPLTDSALRKSHERIRRGLHESGNIYKNDLEEYQLSAKQFMEIYNRYPSDPNTDEALYQLYLIHRQQNNVQKSDETKNIILTKYPESVYAKLLRNPNFLNELSQKENEVSILYENAYNNFKSGNYAQGSAMANQGLTQYPNHKLKVKFSFVKTLAEGKMTSLENLRMGLLKFVEEYPNTDESKVANDILVAMDSQRPEVKERVDEIEAKEIYIPVADNEKHFFGVILGAKQANQNQLIFNLINYNLDNYSNANLNVKGEGLGEKSSLVIVSEFANKNEALNYYDAAINFENLYKDVGAGVLATFVISETNLGILRKDASDSKYLKFFKLNYNR